MKCEKNIKVGPSWVTAIQYLKASKRLVAACANRSISFYDLNQTNTSIPVSKISDLDGIPLCLDYFNWPDQAKETLLVGDDLGICHMYDF